MTEPSGRHRLTGAQLVVEYLVRQGVPVVAGIPGHGSWALTDALLDRRDAIRTVQVMHEQAAVHLADGFYRASGRPILAFTSIGPGATNTVVGMATAYVDSTAVALLTGSPHTYMRGAGLLQELERRHVADNPRIFEPVVKEWWQPSRVDELPFVLHRAWNQMLAGRPGPILLDIPMDVLAESADVRIPEPTRREARGRIRPAADDVERAAVCWRAPRGRSSSPAAEPSAPSASAEITALAERLGAPVVTTWNGKGAIDETHDLAGQTIGDTASSCGNELAAAADILLSVGCRFTDWSASSYRAGVTFSIPPTCLDPDRHRPPRDRQELPGRRRARRRCARGPRRPPRRPRTGRWAGDYRTTTYFEEIARRQATWNEQIEIKSGSTATPMTMARAVREVQARHRRRRDRRDWCRLAPGDGQAALGDAPSADPPDVGRILDDGLRAAGGDRGATRPARSGRCSSISGDGSFLQSMQELQTAVLAGTPICQVVLDNSGWISIKGGQETFFGRSAWTDFLTPDGSIYSPDFAAIGQAFGLHAERVDDPGEVANAVRRGLASGGPSLIHVPVDRDLASAGPDKTGWWDAPSPAYRTDLHDRWREGVAQEQHR